MNHFVCVTCGTQFAAHEKEPDGCPICLNERQYVGPSGQAWTTLAEYMKTHRNVFAEEEPDLHSIHPRPKAGIGQPANWSFADTSSPPVTTRHCTHVAAGLGTPARRYARIGSTSSRPAMPRSTGMNGLHRPGLSLSSSHGAGDGTPSWSARGRWWPRLNLTAHLFLPQAWALACPLLRYATWSYTTPW
jgi:hypothetical protein